MAYLRRGPSQDAAPGPGSWLVFKAEAGLIAYTLDDVL
jgi:hypothetical protein